MALFSGSTYNVKMTVGTDSTLMYPVVSFIDTGGAPNLIDAVFIKSQWNSRIERLDTPRVRASSEKSLPVRRTMLLQVRICVLCARVWFTILDNLAVGLLLGTSFIICYIRPIFLGEHKLIFWHSTPVEIIMSRNVSDSYLEESNGQE